MWIIRILVVLLLAGAVLFFAYFRVEHVEVRGSARYTDEEIKEQVMRGAFAWNSVLAPYFCSQEHAKDIFYVESISVSQIDRNSILISVLEKKPVGCLFYLDSYIYFDRNGIYVEGSRIRDTKLPYFDGIVLNKAIQDKKLNIKGTAVLNTAVTLATIFMKTDNLPEAVRFDESQQLSLDYGDIKVMLGKAEYLEDKMARALAILDILQEEEEAGILHLESVNDIQKIVTFERTQRVFTPETWNGGYDEDGEFTGEGEYDEKGRYVGPRPWTELDYARAAWQGGYDGEGDFTGAGEYDQYGNYVGFYPTQEDIDAHGTWKGGYTETGSYNGTGEYDHSGTYVGPDPNPSQEQPDREMTESTGAASTATGEGVSYNTENSSDLSEDDSASYGSGSYSDDSSGSSGDGYDSGGSYYDESYYDALYYGESDYDDSYYDESYYDESYYDESYYDESYYDESYSDDSYYADSYYDESYN